MKRFDQTEASTLTGTQFVHEWVHHLSDSGLDIIDASRGKPSLPIEDTIIQAMQDTLAHARGHVFPYGTDALGEPAYRETVAEIFTKTYGTTINPSDIIFTPGGQFCLYLAFKILHEQCPDGVFVSTSPAYLNYEELIRYATQQEAPDTLLQVTLDKQNHYHYTPEALSNTLKQNTRPISAFIFCNPLNPTGQVIDAKQWSEFAKILHQYDAPILMDEAFIEVVFNNEKDVSLLQVDPSLKERIILLRSGTKAIGFPGERLSCAMLPSHMVERFRYHQSRLLGNPPMLAQAGMTAALQQLSLSGENKISAYYQNNAEILIRELSELLGDEHYIKPQGGFFLLANFKCLFGKPMPKQAQSSHLTENDTIQSDQDIMAALMFGLRDGYDKGVALIPASYFGVAPQEGLMRISFSIKPDEIKEMMSRLNIMLSGS